VCSWLVFLDSLPLLDFLLRDGIYDQDMVGDAYSFHVLQTIYDTVSMRSIKNLVCLSFANTNGRDILKGVNYAYEGAGIRIKISMSRL
jgi:hypothetical protein